MCFCYHLLHNLKTSSHYINIKNKQSYDLCSFKFQMIILIGLHLHGWEKQTFQIFCCLLFNTLSFHACDESHTGFKANKLFKMFVFTHFLVFHAGARMNCTCHPKQVSACISRQCNVGHFMIV